MNAQLDALNPKGKTPISDALSRAIELVGDRGGVIVLVSDGLETCGGDPCRVVREARAAGVDLVLHVVGFAIDEADVSQLECAAQAGSGAYYAAADADELALALEHAAVADEPPPDSGISVKAVADGELTDVSVQVKRAADGTWVAGGRTYTSPDTNPRVLRLPPDTYHLDITAVGFAGKNSRRLENIVVTEGQMVEKTLDFSSGELTLTVTQNGTPIDATARIYLPGTRKEVAAGRTYGREKRFQLTAGTYDILVKPVKTSGAEDHRFTDVQINGGETTSLSHDFPSGVLSVHALAGEERLDTLVYIIDNESGKTVAQGRTYTGERTNPRTFNLIPGTYRVTAKPVKRNQGEKQEQVVELAAGSEMTVTFDFGTPE
jgi:Ca-activated chloride channel family protein